ncbi:high choriolytic enzyme 1-like [Trichomycterus rosablanca]|uniref:high choriolytic enzyme 1-like n=1 Tax=Trichomycterus rosablanca TaxID=2290929 RepID=UPI002F356B24
MHLSVVLALLLLGVSPAQSRSLKGVNQTHHEEGSGDTADSSEEDFSVSSIIERANKKIGQAPGDPKLMFGDIVMHTGFQNAHPCIFSGCMWPKYSDGRVYVPYAIANHYSYPEIATIERALQSFARSTCIQFVPRSREPDFIYIQSLTGCYSRVGRTGGMQTLSLARHGCIYHHVIQHELLHALGFVHEHSRSDRDNYVRIHLENVIPGQEHNFDKIQTNNLNTPYDYNSVIQYGGLFFSSNQRPTIIPIPDSSVPIGQATQMSHYDIQRVNNLYC